MKKKAIFILVLTYIPVIISLLLQVLYSPFSVSSLNQNNIGFVQQSFLINNIVSVVIFIFELIILIYYIKHIINDPGIAKKSRWIILILLFNVISMTIYWYKNIWKKLNHEEVV